MISSRREDSLKRAQDEIKAGGGADILYHAGDTSKEEDVTALLSDALEKMGTVDAKPNNNWKFVPEAWTKPAAQRDFELLFGKKQ